jgi:hypothetical protein
MTTFKKATRAQARARVAIDGPAKAGKSFTALRLAFTLGRKVAAIDTEFGSLSKYAGEAPDGIPFDFDVMELTNFRPSNYIDAINAAAAGGYEVLIIDSLSHAWVGEGGILDQADKSKTTNKFTDWAKLTPQQRALVDAILAAPIHIIVTMRSKMEYVLETQNGKQVPRKVGMAPVQREGMEYEFDLLLTLDNDHHCVVGGSRCSAMDGQTSAKPGAKFFAPFAIWLGQGAPVEAAVPATVPVVAEARRLLMENVQRVLKLATTRKAITGDEYAKLLKRYEVRTANDLADVQLTELGGWLQAMLDEADRMKAESEAA